MPRKASQVIDMCLAIIPALASSRTRHLGKPARLKRATRGLDYLPNSSSCKISRKGPRREFRARHV